MTFIYNLKPKIKFIIKTYIVLILYAIPIWIFNIFVGGNYLYLSYKPEGASLLDYFGPWPWYILVIAMGILPCFLLIYYLFYSVGFIKNRFNRKINKEDYE